MKITVNGKKLTLFSGARVADAIQKYSPDELSSVKQGKSEVTDRFGHRVDLDGELSEGAVLQVQEPETGIRKK